MDKFYWDYDSKKAILSNSYAALPGRTSYLFTGFNYKSNFLGLAGAKISEVVHPDLSAALAENPALGAYSWHEPATKPKRDALNALDFVDGHVQQVKIYWDGSNDPILYNPPPGYSYRWTSEKESSIPCSNFLKITNPWQIAGKSKIGNAAGKPSSG